MPTSLPYSWRKILLIRHGATALNSNDHTVDRIRGWSDWPLSEEGRLEAHNLAARFSQEPGILFCSNLTRARQTAEIIARVRNIPLEMSAAFLPWNVGIYVGANAADTVPELARFAVRKPLEAVPGGESFHTFRTRFFMGLLKALRENKGMIGIVTHQRNERLLKAWAKLGYPENGDIDVSEFTRKGETTGHCEIIKVPLDRLQLYAQHVKLQGMAFGDGREEKWREWAIENL